MCVLGLTNVQKLFHGRDERGVGRFQKEEEEEGEGRHADEN